MLTPIVPGQLISRPELSCSNAFTVVSVPAIQSAFHVYLIDTVVILTHAYLYFSDANQYRLANTNVNNIWLSVTVKNIACERCRSCRVPHFT